jgi:hypothetical protein
VKDLRQEIADDGLPFNFELCSAAVWNTEVPLELDENQALASLGRWETRFNPEVNVKSNDFRIMYAPTSAHAATPITQEQLTRRMQTIKRLFAPMDDELAEWNAFYAAMAGTR